MKKQFSLILVGAIFCGSLSSFNELIPKKEKKEMRTSVIVPCVARHFFWLSGMLEAYQNQTVRPDEVVISLSEVEKIPASQIAFLEKGLWDFKLKIIRNNGVVFEGQNRTIAMDNSTGDILIFSDADDLPHPQRVEVAKYIFENYEVDHMLHAFASSRKNVSPILIKDIQPLRFANFDEILRYAYAANVPITTGSPCCLRKVGNAIKWSGTADVEYTRQVYAKFKNNIVLNLNLILYRLNLSSYQ